LSYDRNPHYPLAAGEVEVGYERLAGELANRGAGVLAIDGPAALDWAQLASGLSDALAAHGLAARVIDTRLFFAPWKEVERRTAAATLPDDPVFARIFEGTLASLFDDLPPRPRPPEGEVAIVSGPGSALMPHDLLWYADLPKRLSLMKMQKGEAGNVGQPPGEAGSEQRLLFVDWPLLDRHKQGLTPRLDRYIDLSEPHAPRSVGGDSLRETLAEVASAPFRTRPTFLPGPWGGQWIRQTLGVSTDGPNLAWSYELITPEGGLLLGEKQPLEVGFELLMAEQGERILGPELSERFGLSFPIRFDYLDTLGGGDLSIQAHPTDEYMRETFGLPFTQHESYYVMVTSPGASIFLGLREDADLEAFRQEAERAIDPGVAFAPARYLQTHPAEQHRLYLIPGGTPHASGAGNVVLEISATPYLYTLRFYDWLRRDLDGTLRPVHLRHAFANIDGRRRGAAVRRDLIPEARIVRAGEGWAEVALGSLPELFFAVHRLEFDDAVEEEARGRFHVLNLVAGEEIVLETAGGRTHPLSYAETIVVPAAVGPYRLRRRTGPPCKVVKAFVR
jgi:mannose-6-phosphate isomerase class I